MANSYVEYTSVAGGTTNLNVPFSYLDPAQVELYIDNVLQTVVTHYNFTSPTNIALVTPTSGGEDILIQRRTEIDSAAVTFSNAMLVDTDLNTSHLQNFYLHQEVVDGLAIGTYPVLADAITSTGATVNYVLTADGAGGVSWMPVGSIGGTLANIVEDLSPQLGANLEMNGFNIINDGALYLNRPTATGAQGIEMTTNVANSKAYNGVYNAESGQYFEYGVHGSTFAGTPNHKMYFASSVAQFDLESDYGIIWSIADVNGLSPNMELFMDLVMDDEFFIQFGTGADATLGYENAGNQVMFDLTPLSASMTFDLDANSNFNILEDGSERVVIDIFQGLFEIHDGFQMRFIEQAGTDYGSIQNNGTGMVFDHNTGGSYFFEGGGNLLLREGGTLAVYDASNADYASFSHDGTDLNMDFLGTSNWNVNLNTDAAVIVDNGSTVFSNPGIQLQGDAPTLGFYDDGAPANGQLWTLGTASNAFRLRLFTDAYAANNDAIVVGRGSGTNDVSYVYLYAAGNACIGTQDRTATGNTSGGFVKDHDGNNVDIGFNVLNEKGWGAADTLEAQHAGGSWGKANTTARTLTLEASTTEDFPVGGVCQIFNLGTSGNLTITEGTGTTLYKVVNGSGQVDSTGSLLVGPGGVCTLWRRNSTTYYLMGSEIT